MAEPEAVRRDRVRVLVVDDAEDVRVLLRMQLARDPRFHVVGEAADGIEAIELAAAHQPDLVILDRQMPRLGGLEAIPEIRRRAPQSAIVLYTAQTDASTYHAALDAGAIQVLDKVGVAGGFADQLVRALQRGASAGAVGMEIHVGPVASKAVLVWVENTRKIINAVAAHPEVLGQSIPDDVIELFRSFLQQWEAIAATTDQFRWVARAHPRDVSRVVNNWAVIDSMTDDQLARLGVHWSPREGAEFFIALTTGVLAALRRNEDTQRLAERLGEKWESYQS